MNVRMESPPLPSLDEEKGVCAEAIGVFGRAAEFETVLTGKRSKQARELREGGGELNIRKR